MFVGLLGVTGMSPSRRVWPGEDARRSVEPLFVSVTDASAAAKNVVAFASLWMTTIMAIYRTHMHLSASIAP
jgi:hypothetical protein